MMEYPATACSRIFSSADARTRGWMIASSFFLPSLSLKMTVRSFCRSRLWSGCRTPAPKASMISFQASLPGSTTSRDKASALITAAPSRSRIFATVLFPEAIPPVRPTNFTQYYWQNQHRLASIRIQPITDKARVVIHGTSVNLHDKLLSLLYGGEGVIALQERRV